MYVLLVQFNLTRTKVLDASNRSVMRENHLHEEVRHTRLFCRDRDAFRCLSILSRPALTPVKMMSDNIFPKLSFAQSRIAELFFRTKTKEGKCH